MLKQKDEVVERELREITGALVREYRLEKIILFGSRACGTPQWDSDVDLCAVKDDAKNPLDMMHEARRAIFGLSTVGVDLVVYTPSRFAERLRMGDPFARRIAQQGITLYDAERRG